MKSKSLLALYSLCGQTVISGFRTSSDETACIIATMLLTDICNDEIDSIYSKIVSGTLEANDHRRIMKEERRVSVSRWPPRL